MRLNLAILALSVSTLSAQTTQAGGSIQRRIAPAEGSRKALVIGNSNYPKSPLKNPLNDAESMTLALRELGFNVTTARNLSLQQTEETIGRFTESLKADDVAIFYYSGHGLQFQQENYLVPIDYSATAASDVKYKSYPASRVRDRMEEAGARVRIIILDACRDNPFRSSKTTTGGLSPMRSDAAGTLIAYATADGQTAEDNPAERNGLYTKFLLRRLKQKDLDIRAIFRKTGDDVFSASARRQRPFLYDGLTGDDMYLTDPPTAAASTKPTVALGVDMAALAYDRLKTNHTRAGLEAFLSEFPDSDYAKLVRIDLANLPGTPTTAPAQVDVLAEGRRLHASARFTEEFNLYQKAAEGGDARAMSWLGYSYAQGLGVDRNENLAVSWYKKAAQNGDLSAKSRLGYMLINGRGVDKDEAEGVRLCREAAQGGDMIGMGNYGLLLQNGLGVAKDEPEGHRWTRQSAEAGSAAAMTNLGSQFRLGRGTDKDLDQAIKWYRRASDAGHYSGMLSLAEAYANGQGVERDLNEARRWARKAFDYGGGATAKSLIDKIEAAANSTNGTKTASNSRSVDQQQPQQPPQKPADLWRCLNFNRQFQIRKDDKRIYIQGINSAETGDLKWIPNRKNPTRGRWTGTWRMVLNNGATTESLIMMTGSQDNRLEFEITYSKSGQNTAGIVNGIGAALAGDTAEITLVFVREQ